MSSVTHLEPTGIGGVADEQHDLGVLVQPTHAVLHRHVQAMAVMLLGTLQNTLSLRHRRGTQRARCQLGV